MTNAAAIGYALIAGKDMGLTPKQLQELERMMRSVMDTTTEEEAEECYRNN